MKLPCQTPTSSSPFWKIFSFWIFYWWKMIHRLKLLFGDVFSSHSSQCFGLQWERKCWQCAVWASYCCFLYCNNIKPTSDPGEGGIVGSCGHSDSSGNQRGSVTLFFLFIVLKTWHLAFLGISEATRVLSDSLCSFTFFLIDCHSCLP